MRNNELWNVQKQKYAVKLYEPIDELSQSLKWYVLFLEIIALSYEEINTHVNVNDDRPRERIIYQLLSIET